VLSAGSMLNINFSNFSKFSFISAGYLNNSAIHEALYRGETSHYRPLPLKNPVIFHSDVSAANQNNILKFLASKIIYNFLPKARTDQYGGSVQAVTYNLQC
jgi:hypothetical protein